MKFGRKVPKWQLGFTFDFDFFGSQLREGYRGPCQTDNSSLPPPSGRGPTREPCPHLPPSPPGDCNPTVTRNPIEGRRGRGACPGPPMGTARPSPVPLGHITLHNPSERNLHHKHSHYFIFRCFQTGCVLFPLDPDGMMLKLQAFTPFFKFFFMKSGLRV